MFKLACEKNPKKEGIELEDGSWDMNKFEEHVKNCEICRGVSNRLIKKIRQEIEGDGPRNSSHGN